MEYSFMEPFLVNELINGVSINYEKYNNIELIEILSFLNKLSKDKKEIFAFEEKAIDNYKKIIDIVKENTFDKEVLLGYTRIFQLEKMLEDENLKSKLKDEFIKEQIVLRKIDNKTNIDNLLRKCIMMDKTLIVYIYHKVVYGSKKTKDDLDLIRYSMNYFYSLNDDKELYDQYVELCREKNIHIYHREPCKILDFPKKKRSLVNSLLKK